MRYVEGLNEARPPLAGCFRILPLLVVFGIDDMQPRRTAGRQELLITILLGLELTRVQWSKHMGVISVSTALRLIVGPLIGLGLSILFGMPVPARQAIVVEAGMPTAIMTTILANEYELESQLVTATVFISTIISPLTLTPLLFLLGS